MRIIDVVYSLILHLVVFLFISGVFVINHLSSKRFDEEQQEEVQLMKLDIGIIDGLEAKITDDYSKDALDAAEGLDDSRYGRVVSQIVLAKLNKAGIVIGNNRADIILKLNQDGKLLGSTVLLRAHDEVLYQSIIHALSHNIVFPKNTKANGVLSYKLLLF